MNETNTKEALIRADALYKSGNIEEAFELYQSITQAAPKTTEAWYNLGVLSLNLQRDDLAENFFREAVRWNKRNPDFFNALGETQYRLGKLDEAGDSFAKALKRDPASIRTINNIGRLYLEQGNNQAAEKEFTRALKLAPNNPQLMLNLSSILINTERFDEAKQLLEKAISLAPEEMMLRYNMARVFYYQQQHKKAVEYCKESLKSELTPYLAALFRNLLGTIYQDVTRFELAEENYLQALELNPQQIESHTSLGLVRVIQGKLETGWPELAWVIHKNRYLDQFSSPLWMGEALAGKRVTYLAEQGVGDELLFANLFSDLIKNAGCCTIECDQRLIPLFSRSFPDANFIARQKPPKKELVDNQADFITWGSSAAIQFRREPDQFPSEPGYLSPSPERVEYWSEKLRDIDGNNKVGICWRSMVTSKQRDAYSNIVDDWDTLLMQKNLTFINLQYDNCDEELAAVREKLGVTIHDLDIDLMNDLDDVAALIDALDLVISSHTAVAALSGAVGKETYVLSPRYNWTMLGTDAFPWYPKSHALVQQAEQPWSELLNDLSHQLATKYS
jgi:Flp pilus assembly protein TadD